MLRGLNLKSRDTIQVRISCNLRPVQKINRNFLRRQPFEHARSYFNSVRVREFSNSATSRWYMVRRILNLIGLFIYFYLGKPRGFWYFENSPNLVFEIQARHGFFMRRQKISGGVISDISRLSVLLSSFWCYILKNCR